MYKKRYTNKDLFLELQKIRIGLEIILAANANFSSQKAVFAENYPVEPSEEIDENNGYTRNHYSAATPEELSLSIFDLLYTENGYETLLDSRNGDELNVFSKYFQRRATISIGYNYVVDMGAGKKRYKDYKRVTKYLAENGIPLEK